MNNKDLFKKTAQAIRELVSENDKLQAEKSIYKECIKIAFEYAEHGQIEKDFESIESKANELFDNKEELPVIKKAMELNLNHSAIIGDLEKDASYGGSTKESELDEILSILEGSSY